MKKSYIIAAIMALGITAWVLAGYLFQSPVTANVAPAGAEKHTIEPMRVSVRAAKAQPVERHIVAQGHAEPNRTVTVRAETAGQVEQIVKDEGATVSAGDVIVRLEVKDRAALLERAKARVREQENAHEASQKLGEKGYQTQRRSDETYSALQTAKAEMEEARIALENTEIRAPFDGVVMTSDVEIGTYADVNGEIATIVDNDPLVISVRIPQHDITSIQVGRTASVTFATGEKREGRVNYVAPRADIDTRTFRVEVQVANPEGKIPSGISVEAKIPTGSVFAQFVSPATLSLNDKGVLGVKTVDADNKVRFHPAKIVRSDVDGVWLTGLDDEARIITVGAGFVRVGDEVKPVLEKENSGSDGSPRASVMLSKPDGKGQGSGK
ncbi:MAG: efflux RND transporter periplasmic adaptor subunit [Hyphomicrobiaceae bacterium]|nr:efflux RND transporter periplasmic adaptor subunit [Hyphomicrobiaceae bacterium]